MSLRTMNWKVPTSDVSSAVMSTSPLPWPAWPSPISKQRALRVDGDESVVPATSSLLSRLPAWIPGGALFSRPIDARRRHAHAAEERAERDLDARRRTCATIRFASSGMMRIFE